MPHHPSDPTREIPFCQIVRFPLVAEKSTRYDKASLTYSPYLGSPSYSTRPLSRYFCLQHRSQWSHEREVASSFTIDLDPLGLLRRGPL
jgi:hypothetical protein